MICRTQLTHLTFDTFTFGHIHFWHNSIYMWHIWHPIHMTYYIHLTHIITSQVWPHSNYTFTFDIQLIHTYIHSIDTLYICMHALNITYVTIYICMHTCQHIQFAYNSLNTYTIYMYAHMSHSINSHIHSLNWHTIYM